MKKEFLVGLFLTISLVGCGLNRLDFTEDIYEERYEHFQNTADEVYDILDSYDLEPDKDRAEEGFLEGELNEVESKRPDNGYYEIDYELIGLLNSTTVIELRTRTNMERAAKGEEFTFEDSMLGELREVILGNRKPSSDIDNLIKLAAISDEKEKWISVGNEEGVEEKFFIDNYGDLHYIILIG